MTLPSRILGAKKIRPLMCVMFDDGLPSDYTIAYHEMWTLRGLQGVSNVPTGWVDTAGHLTWVQIEEMHSTGWDFGCHTQYHTRLTEMTHEQIRASLQAVNDDYTAHGIPIPVHHVPPASLITPDRQAVVLEYRLAIHNVHNSGPTLNLKRLVNFTYPGFTLLPHWGVNDLNTTEGLNIFKALIDLAVSRREMFIIVMHRIVDELSEPYSAMELLRTQFAAMLDYAVNAGIEFVSFRELYQYVTDYRALA